MKTEIRTVSPAAIREAAALLRAGELVAFPTETVYGLGADAFSSTAITKIFAAKNRPADNPLIIHISDVAMLSAVAREVSSTAKALIAAFWPGPLSIVLPKHPHIPAVATAGLDTVVVRFPAHPAAQALISAAGPLAAPSANRSGKVSPTMAAHVFADLQNKIPLILDGGAIEYGLESTVVDATTAPAVILRPGSITREQLEPVVPTIDVAEAEKSVQRSPGMKYRHYAPDTPMILFQGPAEQTIEQIRARTLEEPQAFVIWHEGENVFSNHLQLPVDPTLAAPKIFTALRSADARNASVILFQGFPKTGIGAAIFNRLEKAASEILVA